LEAKEFNRRLRKGSTGAAAGCLAAADRSIDEVFLFLLFNRQIVAQ
jgi:hypothetical protein